MKRNAFRLIYFVVALLCVFVCLTSCKTNPDNTSSGAEASAVDTVSDKENVNSEDVSSEETTSEPEEVASEPVEVQGNTATASQTTTKKQTNSQASKTQTTQQTQQTQQTQPIQQQSSGPAWNGTLGNVDPTWTCPDPSAHGGYASDCFNKLKHEDMIQELKQEQEILNNYYTQGAAKWGMSVEEFKVWEKTHCSVCGRVKGDGHNGTCTRYLDDAVGHWVCINYD